MPQNFRKRFGKLRSLIFAIDRHEHQVRSNHHSEHAMTNRSVLEMVMPWMCSTNGKIALAK
jgi:hypothetical protein